MCVLESGEARELLESCLHVVPGDSFTAVYRLQIDLVDDALIRVDRLLGNIDPQVPLCTHDRNPQASFEHDLVGR